MHAHAHPLLMAWGRQSRDYVRLLDDLESSTHLAQAISRIDIYDEAPNDQGSLLEQVQRSIRDLLPLAEHPKATQPQHCIAAADQSIVLHSAHSLVRELEVLHDHLLTLLAAPPPAGQAPLQPRNIIVMLPDIAAAAPAIRAVFGLHAHNDPRRIPFAIADLAAQAHSPLVVALQWLLRLPQQRCHFSDLASLLDVPAVAARLGLPVAGVLGFVSSYADGAHTSIPAPGLGALGAGMGGGGSSLVARALAALGVTPDDIAVVSKHDTSTNANDPNESELHNTLAHAIGRADGNPLFVISQKSLTGHAKGGACIFQVNGLTQLFKSGVVPANAALDCVDPKLKRDDHMVWLREPLKVGSVKAGLATSLGFGHVSGFAAIVNPGAFEASVANTAGEDALNEWRDRANARLAAGQRRLEEGMMGRAALYEPIDNRRFHEDGRGYDAHEVEKAMLLDPNARLASTGYFEA